MEINGGDNNGVFHHDLWGDNFRVKPNELFMDINGGDKNRVFLHDLIKITEGTVSEGTIFMHIICIILILNKFRHIWESCQIVLSGLKEYLSLWSILSIRNVLILRSTLSNLSSNLGLNYFESCFSLQLQFANLYDLWSDTATYFNQWLHHS